MSILSLQFGQCGNQIGQSLYSTVQEDINSKNSPKSQFCIQSVNKWFNVNNKGTWEPRAILIDTETKVIENIQNSTLKFNSVVAKSFGGSANNWAYGYIETSKLVASEVLNCVRSEIEKSDFLTFFLNLYSLSGGTGSGVGSYIIEKISEEYPKKTIVNCAVLPYLNGEISTQSYNCVLNLSQLYSVGDCTVLFENDRLLHRCKYNLGFSEVTNSNINLLISQQLASAFQPISGIDTQSLLNHLTAHPSYKFLQMRTEPNFQKQNSNFESVQQWRALTSSLSKQSRFDMQQIKNASGNFVIKNICSTLLARSGESVPEDIVAGFEESRESVTWLPKEEYFKVYCENTPFLTYQKYINNIFNNNNICLPLNNIMEDAWTSFIHGAYLHHYKNYVTEPSKWSDEDKRLLLVALRKYGDSDLALLQGSIPQRSIVEIRALIDHYKKLAQNKWLSHENKKTDEIRNWIEIIEKISLRQKGLILDIIPRVLKYIALFEKRSVESDIDLGTAYNFLSEISYGKSGKELPERTGFFLYQCLVKLAENLQKQDIQESQIYLKQLEKFEELLKPSEKNEINPLHVPQNLLIISDVDFNKDAA